MANISWLVLDAISLEADSHLLSKVAQSRVSKRAKSGTTTTTSQKRTYDDGGGDRDTREADKVCYLSCDNLMC